MMLLSELLRCPDLPSVQVKGLSQDSNQVNPGDLFVAYRGQKFDGHDFAQDAIDRGAIAVCAEREPIQHTKVPWVRVSNLASRQSELAARFYGHPSQTLNVTGVTGTNGKTSVVWGIASLLDSTAYIGTLGVGSPSSLRLVPLTTMEPISLQANLAKLLEQNYKSVAMEVSSHALDQGRVEDIEFNTAVFTNLTREHLDYHKTMDNYAKAKRKLFQRVDLRCGVINLDDHLGCAIARDLSARGVELFTYGTKSDATLSWSHIRPGTEGMTGTWLSHWGVARFNLPFLGSCFVSNAAAILLVAVQNGMDFTQAVERMSELKTAPGRMELLTQQGAPSVVLDYAHTPDALEQALGSARAHSKGNVVCVFGCGGDRDKSKRPEMGSVAETLADVVFVTNDNPRTESPTQIAQEIQAGFSEHADCVVELDRTTAIEQAIAAASENDVVLVAGKGHEEYQEIGTTRLPYSDRDVISEILKREF